MRSVLKKHGLSVFLCSSSSSLCSLWHCVEKSSYCDSVLDDNVWMWGGWVRHDRGEDVTRLAQPTAPRGEWTCPQLLMHPHLCTFSLPWGTLSLVRDYSPWCCWSLFLCSCGSELIRAGKPAELSKTWDYKLCGQTPVSTTCSLGQPPSVSLEKDMYECGSQLCRNSS